MIQMKKKIAILGSTGSIGKTLLDIVSKDKNKFDVILLTANKNYKQLLSQVEKFNVKNVIINDATSYKKFISKNKIKFKYLPNFNSFDKIFKKN